MTARTAALRRAPTGPSIIQMMDDFFGRSYLGPSWAPWRVVLKGLFGLPMAETEVPTWRELTGRQTPPTTPAREGWFICGRRAGKSMILALVAVYMACFKDFTPHLAPGEVATIMTIAADRKQARTIFRYVEGLLDGTPMLRGLVTRKTQEALHLGSRRVVIEIHAASFRGTRGYSIPIGLLDECAFWPDEESANPAQETVNAIRPATLTMPGSLILGASSPWSRRGLLYDMHQRHWAKDNDPVVVVQAPTLTLNPTVDRAFIAEAYEQDPAAAAAEYGAQWREDIDAFISRELVEACVIRGRHSLPPQPQLRYHAFVDTAAGPTEHTDSMTLAIAHREGDRLLLDVLCERRPPFSPHEVAEQFAGLCRPYTGTVTGDRYGSRISLEMFQAVGLRFSTADRVKSDLYRDLLPLLTSRRVELLDEPRLVTQLIRLERRASRMGRETITHPPGSHDDVVNAAAGALVLAAGRRRGRPAFQGLAEYLSQHPEAETVVNQPPAQEWTMRDLHLAAGVLPGAQTRSGIVCSSCGALDDGAIPGPWTMRRGEDWQLTATCPRCAVEPRGSA